MELPSRFEAGEFTLGLKQGEGSCLSKYSWFFLGLLAVVVRVVVYAYGGGVSNSFDGEEYIRASQQLPDLIGFLQENKKGPTYPIFLSLVNTIGFGLPSIAVVQLLLDMLSQFVYTYILYEIAGRRLALVGFVAYFGNYSLMRLGCSILSESLSSWLLATHLLLMMFSYQKAGKIWSTLYSINTTALIFSRTALSYILLADLVFLWPDKRRRGIILIPVAALVFFSAGNLLVNGTFTPNRYSKFNFVKVSRVCIAELQPDDLPPKLQPPLIRYQAILNEKGDVPDSSIIAKVSTVVFGDPRVLPIFPLTTLLYEQRRPFDETVDEYFKMAIIAVKTRPLTYLKTALIGIAAYLSGPFDIKGTLVDELGFILIFAALHILIFWRTANVFTLGRSFEFLSYLGLVVLGNFIISNAFEMDENQRYATIVLPVIATYFLGWIRIRNNHTHA